MFTIEQKTEILNNFKSIIQNINKPILNVTPIACQSIGWAGCLLSQIYSPNNNLNVDCYYSNVPEYININQQITADFTRFWDYSIYGGSENDIVRRQEIIDLIKPLLQEFDPSINSTLIEVKEVQPV